MTFTECTWFNSTRCTNLEKNVLLYNFQSRAWRVKIAEINKAFFTPLVCYRILIWCRIFFYYRNRNSKRLLKKPCRRSEATKQKGKWLPKRKTSKKPSIINYVRIKKKVFQSLKRFSFLEDVLVYSWYKNIVLPYF